MAGVAEALSTIDWQALATNAGVFVAAVFATMVGWRREKKKAEDEPKNSANATVLQGGILMDNMAMVMLSEALKEATKEILMARHCVGVQTHAIEELTREIRGKSFP